MKPDKRDSIWHRRARVAYQERPSEVVLRIGEEEPSNHSGQCGQRQRAAEHPRRVHGVADHRSGARAGVLVVSAGGGEL